MQTTYDSRDLSDLRDKNDERGSDHIHRDGVTEHSPGRNVGWKKIGRSRKRLPDVLAVPVVRQGFIQACVVTAKKKRWGVRIKMANCADVARERHNRKTRQRH